MLNRDEIIRLVQNDGITGKILSRDLVKDLYSRESSFQPGSIDLHVGEIYVPHKRDSDVKPVSKCILRPGATIMVRTMEECNLPCNIGGICLSPATQSLEGVLIINIGHVDPGYNGYLHFTMVNLGRDAIEIRESDILITMLLFRYDHCKNEEKLSISRDKQAMVKRLAVSFMDFEDTIKKKVRKAAFLTPIFVTALGLCLTFFLTYVVGILLQNNSLQTQLHEQQRITREHSDTIEYLKQRVDDFPFTQ